MDELYELVKIVHNVSNDDIDKCLSRIDSKDKVDIIVDHYKKYIMKILNEINDYIFNYFISNNMSKEDGNYVIIRGIMTNPTFTYSEPKVISRSDSERRKISKSEEFDPNIKVYYGNSWESYSIKTSYIKNISDNALKELYKNSNHKMFFSKFDFKFNIDDDHKYKTYTTFEIHKKMVF